MRGLIALGGSIALGLCVFATTVRAVPRQQSTGLIMGRVVDALTSQPIGGAVVRLGDRTVQADDAGRFVFVELPRAVYSIEASSPGYLDGAYGRQRPDGPAATLALGRDERLSDVRIQLFPYGAIEGAVLDEAGEPVVGAEVFALTRSWVGGRSVLKQRFSTLSDDRGLYRIGSLGAGDFVIAVIHDTLPVERAGHRYIYPVHYFPGSRSVEQAATVTLEVGEERRNVDIALRLSTAVKVTGVLRTPTAPVAAPIELTTTVEEHGGADLSAVGTTSEPDGRFEFLAVPTGTFTAKAIVVPPSARSAESTAPTRVMWASVPVFVNDSDVTDLEILLRPGFRISGRVVFDDSSAGPAPTPDRTRPVVTINSPDVDVRSLGDRPPERVAAGGFFFVSDLPPGHYAIGLEGLPAGWTVRAVTFRGRDVTNSLLNLTSDAAGLTIAVTDRPASLAGTVRSDAGTIEGATVIVFPRERSTWNDFGPRSPGFRASRSSRDGSFQFDALPPGDYFLIAVDAVAATDWQQPGRLAALARAATPITLATGQQRSLDLRPSVIR